LIGGGAAAADDKGGGLTHDIARAVV